MIRVLQAESLYFLGLIFGVTYVTATEVHFRFIVATINRALPPQVLASVDLFEGRFGAGGDSFGVGNQRWQRDLDCGSNRPQLGYVGDFLVVDNARERSVWNAGDSFHVGF